MDDSFFTPWHGFFYGGFALTAAALLSVLAINRRRGAPWRTALPAGYGPALLGAAIFALGGVGDLIWHTLFGIEKDFDALVSPTHLLLGLGMALVAAAPLAAAWQRPGSSGWRALTPALLSSTLLLSIFTFFMMFSHLLMSIIGGRAHPHFNQEIGQVAGVVSLMLTANLLLGVIFILLRRLPPGTVTLIWGANALAMAIVDWDSPFASVLLGAMLVAVIGCDWLLGWAQRRWPQTGRLRIFAFVAPLLLFGAYFGALLLTEGSHWTIHLIGGAIFLPAVAGLLLSYVAWPPAVPAYER